MDIIKQEVNNPMEVQQNQGSKMLKVTGILMIIGGALALVIALIAVIGIAAAASLAAGALGGGIIALAVIASILSLLGGGIELAAGILGVKNWNQPAKAQSCIVFGAIIIALSVLSNILNLASGSEFNLFTLLLGLVLPVLYLIGAVQLKNMA